MPGVPGACDWSRFTVRGAIFLSVDHGLAAGTVVEPGVPVQLGAPFDRPMQSELVVAC